MHGRRKQHGPDMFGEPSRELELGDTCARNCVAWLIGKTMIGAIKGVNDAISLILTCGRTLGFQAGSDCRDHGGTSCVGAFGDVTRIRRTIPVIQLQSVRGGRARHPPQFREAPGPGEPCWHHPDAGQPL